MLIGIHQISRRLAKDPWTVEPNPKRRSINNGMRLSAYACVSMIFFQSWTMRNDDLLKCFIFHLTSPFVVFKASASNGMVRFQSRLVLSLINTIYVSGQWITAIYVMNYIKGFVYGRSVICCVIKLEVVGLKIDRSLAGDGISPSVTLNRLFEGAYESSLARLIRWMNESCFYRRRVTFPL